MMTQYEVPTFIADKLPGIRSDLKTSLFDCRQNGNIYRSIQVLADYTRRMAIEHNFGMVKKCMGLVDSIYEKGNPGVQHAVENVFVFSFSSLMASCNILECRMVQSYMPVRLYTLYIRQVVHSRP